MNAPWTLAVVVGSVREGRIGATVAHWFAEEIRRGPHTEIRPDILDLAALDLPNDLAGGGDSEDFGRRIEAADAVVVVTPEYNRGYPGPLKTAIDTTATPWNAKPVGFVAYGGVSGGLRAVEQLRPVFAELHAVTVQAVVALPYAWDLIDVNGTMNAPRAEGAVITMLDQLSWWAHALRDARAAEPYAR